MTNTLVNTKITKDTDKAPTPMPMGMNMLVNGKVAKWTDTAAILGGMEKIRR